MLPWLPSMHLATLATLPACSPTFLFPIPPPPLRSTLQEVEVSSEGLEGLEEVSPSIPIEVSENHHLTTEYPGKDGWRGFESHRCHHEYPGKDGARGRCGEKRRCSWIRCIPGLAQLSTGFPSVCSPWRPGGEAASTNGWMDGWTHQAKSGLEAAFSTLDLVFQKNNWPNSQILRCVFMTNMTKYSHKKLQKFVT